jgi:hypothetical protein
MFPSRVFEHLLEGQGKGCGVGDALQAEVDLGYAGEYRE